MFSEVKQIIYKVTEGCNLRCSYCYVYDKGETRGKIVSDELWEYSLNKIFQESRHGSMNNENNLNGVPIELTFHGGEPLSIGKKKFSKLCKIAHQLARRYRKVIQISLQTNATLIDDDWIAIFRKYNIFPGISNDGLLGTSNDERNAKQLQDTVFKLKKFGLFQGGLMVLHKSNFKNVIEEMELMRSMGITTFKINRAVDTTTTGPSKVELNAKELFEVYKKILFYMGAHKEVVENSLDTWARQYLLGNARGIYETDKGSHCYTRWCGAGNALVEIESDGTINFCGRNSSRGKDSVPLSSPGKINMNDVLDLKYSKAALEFHRGKADSVVKNECNLCYAQAICDGGCPAFSYTKYGEVKIDSTTCALNKMIYKLFSENDALVKEIWAKEAKEVESNINYYL